MKFALEKLLGYASEERVWEHRASKALMKVDYMLVAIIKVTQDFDIRSKEILIVDKHDSIQWRPKAIMKSSKGYYYKLKGRSIYLDQSEVQDLREFIIIANNKCN